MNKSNLTFETLSTIFFSVLIITAAAMVFYTAVTTLI